MAQPKIKLPLYLTDLMMEGLSLLGVVFLFIIPFNYYDQLSDVVPTHFGLDGKPDAWGGKNNIWILPIIGLILYIVLTLVNRFPEKLNYLVKITEKNAEHQYQNATKLNRQLKLLIIGFLAYFLYGEVQVALEKAEGLNPVMLFAFVGGILFLIGIHVWRSLQLEK